VAVSQTVVVQQIFVSEVGYVRVCVGDGWVTPAHVGLHVFEVEHWLAGFEERHVLLAAFLVGGALLIDGELDEVGNIRKDDFGILHAESHAVSLGFAGETSQEADGVLSSQLGSEASTTVEVVIEWINIIWIHTVATLLICHPDTILLELPNSGASKIQVPLARPLGHSVSHILRIHILEV